MLVGGDGGNEDGYGQGDDESGTHDAGAVERVELTKWLLTSGELTFEVESGLVIETRKVVIA